MAQRISVVIIGVTDMERALNFYLETFALPIKFKTQTYSEFETEGAILALEKRSEVLSNGASFTFVSDNAVAEEKRLRDRGIRFWKTLTKEDYGLVMYPKDSEGNIFEIVEYKK